MSCRAIRNGADNYPKLIILNFSCYVEKITHNGPYTARRPAVGVATRMSQKQVDKVIDFYRDANFYAMEVWGGAVPDSVMRYLGEDRGTVWNP